MQRRNKMSTVYWHKGLVLLLTCMNFVAEAIPPPHVVARTLGAQNAFPYCVYLEPKQELDCACDDWETDNGFVTFPSVDFLPASASPDGSQTLAKSIRLHSCQKIQFYLDLTPLPKELTKLKFENIGDEVRIRGLNVRANDSIEISFVNVTSGLYISGDFTCPECNRDQNLTRSIINLQIVDTANVTFESLTIDGLSVDFRAEIRAGSSLSILDSFFSNLSSSSVEIFNVPRVDIVHSEFHNVSKGAIVVNRGVKDLTVDGSLLDKDILSALFVTNMTLTCTTSPLRQEDLDPSCTGYVGRHVFEAGVESTGAIVIAVVSGLLLLTAVGALFFLHRHGKLDHYL